MMLNSQAISGVTEVALTLPLQIDNFGSFATTTNQSQIQADRVRTVISTAIGERVMRPEFGNAIPNRTYENVNVMQNSVDSLISEAFSIHLPALELQSVEVLPQKRSNVFEVEVTYLLPDKTEASVVAGVATLDGSNPIEEVTI